MSITQTLKNIFSKKSATNHKIVMQTDSESQKRSAVLDLSSKTMSRIATFTLFCFLSQTFAQTLYAATDGLKGLQIHLHGPVNLASLPTFSLSGTFSGTDDTASSDSDYLATSGSSFSSTGRQARTPTDTSVPVSPTSPKAKEDVQKVLCQASLGGTFIRRIKGEHHHGWGVSTNITKEKNGFKLQVGHQNNLLLSTFISFSGQMSVTHSALTDALSLSVKSYALVHFDKKNEGILGHVSVDAKDMQVTGDWHSDSLTATTRRFAVKDKSALFVHEKAKLTSDVIETKGATLNAKDLIIEAFEIDNENGTLGGMDAATITLKKRTGSRFQNKDGKIGSVKNAVFTIEDGMAIKHLGTLQGEEVVVQHTSGVDDILALTQGVIQASKIVRLYGSTLKGRVSDTLGVRFETPLLWIDAKDFDLLPQTAVKNTQIYLAGLKNFHLTHDYRTAQSFCVTEQNFITKDKAEEALKKPRTQDKEFHIDAVVQAKSMEILTPNYTGVVGLEDGAHSKRGELLTEDYHLDVVAHDFDLQNGVIAADSADFIVREPLKVGRLVDDPDHTVFGLGEPYSSLRCVVSCCGDSLCPTENYLRYSVPLYNILLKGPPPLHTITKVEKKALRCLIKQRGFIKDIKSASAKHHNSSGMLIKNLCSIQGRLVLNGMCEAQDLHLNEENSVMNSGILRVKGDFELKGSLTLKPEVENDFVLNDAPQLYVMGNLSGEGTINNSGSSIHISKQDASTDIKRSNIVSTLLQQRVPCAFIGAAPSRQEVVDRAYDLIMKNTSRSFTNDELKTIKTSLLVLAGDGVNLDWPNIFLYCIVGPENLISARKIFTDHTSSDASIFLSNKTVVDGFLSAPNLLITASPQGLVVGTKNPFYVPPKPAVAMFKFKDLQAIAGANLHMNQIPGVHLSEAFRFYFQERFFHKEEEAQTFYDRVRSDIHIITKDHKIKPYQGQVIKMTPQLMLPWLQKQVQDTLMRGYINPGQAVDFDLLAELHKNGSEYLRRTGLGGDQSETLAMTVYGIDPTNKRIPLPEKPMIFYLIDETDPHKSLMPNIYFPKDLRDGARSDRGSLVHANNFMVIPYGMTGDQFLRLAAHRPEIMGLASSAPALIAHLNRDVSADQPALTARANVEVYGELRIAEALLAITSGHLTVSAKIEAEKALLASLEGDVTLETAIKRIGSGDNWTDVVASTPDVTTRGILAVLAPKGIATIAGAKLTSTESELAIMGRHVLLKSVGLASHRAEMGHKYYKEENNLRQLQSSIKGEKITVMALDTLMTAGVIAESGSLGTNLQGGEVIQQGTYNTHQFSSITHGDSSAFSGGKTTHDNRQTCIALPDEMKSEGNITIVSLKAPLTVVGTKYTIPAYSKVMITTLGGAQFLAAWSEDIHQVANAYKGCAKIEFSGYTEQSRNASSVSVSGGGTMEITLIDEDGEALSDGTPPIRIEMPQGANLDQIKDLSWVTDVLKAHPETELTRVRNEQGKIEYRITAMSPQLTMVIALAVSVCTSGGGLTAMSATQAMTAAATSALITQTITATVGSAMGDGKAFAKAVSEDKLKSVGIDVVCAGLTQGIANSVNTGTLSTLQAACLRTAVRELKVVALTGKWDAKGCLSREVATTIEGAAQSLVKSIGDKYSKDPITGLSQISGLEHKMLHGLTASIAEAAAGLAESAITGQKVQGLLERSVAAGGGAVLVECVAEALYDPKDLLPLDEMSALKKEAVQNAQTKLGESADPQKLAEETIRQFGALYHPHQNNHLENTRKIALLTNIAICALTNNPEVLQAMHRAADRALTHNFMQCAGRTVLAETIIGQRLVQGLAAAGGARLAKEALDFIGVKAVDGGYSYNDRVYGSVNDVLAAVMFDNPATQAAGSIYLVAKTLLDVVVNKTGLDLSSISSYDKPSQIESGKQPHSGKAGPRQDQQSSAATGGAPPPEDPDDGKGNLKENKLTEKQKQQLEGKKLEGENPGNVAPGNRGFTNVDTEKLGGLDEAKRTFERLTGEKPPSSLRNPGDRFRRVLPDEKEVQIRVEGNSGHPKIEITDRVQGLYEKVTFK